VSVSGRSAGLEPTRGWALAALGAALAAQLVWFALAIRAGEPPAGELVRPAIFTVVMGLLLLTRGRMPAAHLLARLVIGGAFLDALRLRFGAFDSFIGYTALVTSFLPEAMAPFLAVLATALESTLGVAILLGISTSWAAAGSAALLFLFATSMEISGLDQFEWAVYVLSAGAWVVAASGTRFLTVDNWIAATRPAPD
jgi:hypothetical protein